MDKLNRAQNKILEIALALTEPDEYSVLLKNIINESMSITNCDAGTLYILNDDKLEFKIMITKSKGISLGGDGSAISLPPVLVDSNSVSSFVARTGHNLFIDNVYEDTEFDWEGPKKYDIINDYRSISLAAIPLVNHEQKIIGVLQLINAQDEEGNIIPFNDEDKVILDAIASLAAISLSNFNMINQLQTLLDSVVSSFTTAIDARTPYNANHTRHVTEYCRRFCDYINKCNHMDLTHYFLNQNQIEQIVMAAGLHDVGKLVIPSELMNKSDRLGTKLEGMQVRWKWLKTDFKVKFYSGIVTLEEYNSGLAEYDRLINYILNINKSAYLTDEDFAEIDKLKTVKYLSSENEWIDFITDEEINELKIHTGTLTNEERDIIEHHAEYTSQILSKISFGDKYNQVRFFAGAHHEFLDGSGYPEGLKAKNIPLEVRIITIMDIFDSLTSSDRPYRNKSSKEDAIKTLFSMADAGKLDIELVQLTAKFFEKNEII